MKISQSCRNMKFKFIKLKEELNFNEIHFFVFDEFRIGQNKNYCWENVISAINKSDKKFVIEI